MNGYGVIRAISRKLARFGSDQSGAAALILAAAIMTIGFTALAIFLKNSQSQHELERAKAGGSQQQRIVGAILAYYQNGDTSIHPATVTIPCPDTKATPDGTAATTCNNGGATTTATAGVIPWTTLGLSQRDVIDAYGNYYTYVVASNVIYDAADSSKNLCESVTNSYSTSTKYYTGKTIIPNLTVSTSTDTTATTAVPFAIVSHGANGLAAKSSGGSYTPASESTNEAHNCHPGTTGCGNNGPTSIYTGPAITSGASTGIFDDQVFTPSPAAVRKTCENLTEGGGLNASMNDGFEGNPTSQTAGGLDSTKWEDGTTDATRADEIKNGARTGNKVARMNAAGGRLTTNKTNYSFDPAVQPRYVAFTWTPDAEDDTHTNTTAGISVGTRATAADLDTTAPITDLFTSNTARGITFRFFDPTKTTRIQLSTYSGTNNDNTIAIYNGSTTVGTSGADTYKLIYGKQYAAEVYDDGNNVWARITQTDDFTNTAVVGPYAIGNADLTGENRIMFINDYNAASVSYIDNVMVGVSMQALALDGATGYVGYAPSGTPSSLGVSATNGLTLEGWFRPRVLPSGSAVAALLSEWDTTDTVTTSSANSFRLYIDSTGGVYASFKGAAAPSTQIAAETYPLNITLEANEWHHVAVTFSTTSHRVRAYYDGVLAFQSASSSMTAGVNSGSRQFRVGADGNSVNYYRGEVSDVRVWNTERTPVQIGANYGSRLAYVDPADGSLDNLVINWKFDPLKETATLGSAPTTTFPDSTAVGTYGAYQTPSSISGGSLATTPNGAISGTATYIGALANYYRPNAGSICSGYITGAYKCDFRVTSAASGASGLATTITVPKNLAAVYAKVWGAGGGGFDDSGTTRDNVGGAGGFSQGLLQYINSTSIAGRTLRVYVGGFGTGSSSTLIGAGGGGGSGLFDSTYHPGLVAGGGGGSAWSEKNVAGGGNDCNNVSSATVQCGLGGPGGGTGTINTLTTAPSENSNCGGRGGDSVAANGPPQGGDCGDGGDPATTPTNALTAQGGGGGTTGYPGGGPTFIAGGYGYNATEADGAPSASATGGGGGGGGRVGGEAGGYEDADNHNGFGGGGGSGYADAGVTNASGTAGSFSAAFSDSSHTAHTHHNHATIPDNVVDQISPALTSGEWQVGYGVSANPNRIPNNTTISTICILATDPGCTYANSIILSNTATGGSDVTVTLTVTGSSSAPVSTPGGNTDFYYSPSYLSATTFTNPGKGGTTGTSVDGHAGAVVLIW